MVLRATFNSAAKPAWLRPAASRAVRMISAGVTRLLPGENKSGPAVAAGPEEKPPDARGRGRRFTSTTRGKLSGVLPFPAATLCQISDNACMIPFRLQGVKGLKGNFGYRHFCRGSIDRGLCCGGRARRVCRGCRRGSRHGGIADESRRSRRRKTSAIADVSRYLGAMSPKARRRSRRRRLMRCACVSGGPDTLAGNSACRMAITSPSLGKWG